MAEFDRRFTENNDILLAISNAHRMELKELKPLESLGISLPSEHELKTAKTYVDREYKDWENEKAKESETKRFNTLATLYKVRDAFPNVYQMYAIIETFGCSTAVCEASFSALAQINIKTRLSMKDDRMRNLAFLAFERERLKSVSTEEVLRKFDNAKERKVQLF